KVKYQGIETVLAMPGVTPHIYGKTNTKPFRKMGHITVINRNLNEAKAIALRVKEAFKVISE
ncbi:MAG: 5-(carboxyamino)imidazole ribonucleotide synthase, partial [Putridiphycobacter sp.]|nr:5-(carboxyamino)imidazole ribonucleotide synthase [Putridiphycobacter sp.]